MYICKNCGQTYTAPSNFCGKCGGEVTEAPDTFNTAYSNPAPAYSYATPVAEAPAAGKGPAIVGMIFGILATILAFVCIAIASEAIDSASYYSSSYYYYYSYYSPSYYINNIREAALAALFVMSIFVLPCMIVGLATSFRKSSLKALSIVGRATSFVGLALLVVSFIMVFSI